MKLHIVWLLPLGLFLTALPAAAQTQIYDNGSIDGTIQGWTINFGFAVSDSFPVSGDGANINGLSFGYWILPTESLVGVEVLITSSEFGGTTYSDQFVNMTTSGCVLNQYGFNVCTATGSFGTDVNLAAGTYWLTLQNATGTDQPIYWDENSGPSSASENQLGTIPSESFTLFGTSSSTTSTTTTTSSTPEPSSIMLLGSGILGLAAIARRKLL